MIYIFIYGCSIVNVARTEDNDVDMYITDGMYPQCA